MDDGGHHYIVDIITNKTILLSSSKLLKRLFLDIIKESPFKVINFTDYQFSSSGCGVTGIILLSESHLSYHTYPESNYISIDIYTCGKNPKTEVQKIINIFGDSQLKVTHLIRGSKEVIKKDNQL